MVASATGQPVSSLVCASVNVRIIMAYPQQEYKLALPTSSS